LGVSLDEIDTAPLGPVAARDGAPVELAMQQLFLTGELFAAGGRLVVRHSFVASGSTPVEAVYPFQLPRDAALRRFRVAGPDFSVHSELQPAGKAAETYEKGLAEGRLAAMAGIYQDGLVNLSVGNLRPGEPVTVWLEILSGVDVRDNGFRFRFPFTVAPSYHPRARTVSPEEGVGQMELPEDEFGDALLPEWRTETAGLHEVGFSLGIHLPAQSGEVSSPSHPVRVRFDGGKAQVSLAGAGDVPNRDLVLDAGFGGEAGLKEPAVFSGRGKDGRTHFAILAPSRFFGERPDAEREVVFVLDRSGSMAGGPIRQAKSALLACLGALKETDRFGIVAFDDVVETFETCLVPATRGGRDRAEEWLEGIYARGGTELAAGVSAAARLTSGEGKGELFLITDGQVWGTDAILAETRETGVAIHSLGLGSAAQDRFLALLARRTGGVSRFVSLRERTDAAALELFAAVSAPVADEVQVRLGGVENAVIEPPPARRVFAGSPLVVFGSAKGGGDIALEVRFRREGAAGERRAGLRIDSGAADETLRLLRGARLITEAESGFGAEEGQTEDLLEAQTARRRHERLTRRLEALGREYGLANRAMSLVAVVERAGDRPGETPRTQVVPVGLPEGMRMHGVFARRAVPHRAGSGSDLAAACTEPTAGARARPDPEEPLYERAAPRHARFERPGDLERLAALAARLEPDGGMPGEDDEDRIGASLCALLAFAERGSGPGHGPFRPHVRRLIKFLRDALPGGLPEEKLEAAVRIIELVKKGWPVPPRDWLRLARPSRSSLRRRWDELLAVF